MGRIINIIAITFLMEVALLSFSGASAQEALTKGGRGMSCMEAFGLADSIVSLDLSGKRLREIPDIVFKMHHLRVLNLSNNRIETLDDRISALHELQELILSRNRLTSLPDAITQLQELRELHLDRNYLSGLPDELGRMKNIEVLILWDNYTSALPESARQLNKLRKLDMRGIPMTRQEQEYIMDMLPNVMIRFSQYCNCKPHVRKNQ